MHLETGTSNSGVLCMTKFRTKHLREGCSQFNVIKERTQRGESQSRSTEYSAKAENIMQKIGEIRDEIQFTYHHRKWIEWIWFHSKVKWLSKHLKVNWIT